MYKSENDDQFIITVCYSKYDLESVISNYRSNYDTLLKNIERYQVVSSKMNFASVQMRTIDHISSNIPRDCRVEDSIHQHCHISRIHLFGAKTYSYTLLCMDTQPYLTPHGNIQNCRYSRDLDLID